MVFHSFHNGENFCNLTEDSYYPQVPALQFPVCLYCHFLFFNLGRSQLFCHHWWLLVRATEL